jgi:hypothetical protein
MSSKGDYTTFKPIIDRILKRAKQEVTLQKGIKEYKNVVRKRALELAEVEKQRLSRNFNTETGNEFYRLFELDLKGFVEKLEDK